LEFPNDLKPRKYEYNILRTLEFNPQGFIFESQNYGIMYMGTTTFHKYKNILLDNGYIQKINQLADKKENNKEEKNIYIITETGRQRLKDIKSIDKKLVFPPKNLELTSEQKILWMLGKNNFCRFGDFQKEGSGISKSTLSNNLNRLRSNNYIIKDNIPELSRSVYKITKSGRGRYLDVLKDKGEDPKTLYEEKIKILSDMNQLNQLFFSEFNIKESNTRYRFNNYKIIFDFNTYKDIFRNNEKNYNLFILYLVLNHPDNYPENITVLDFSQQYNLDEISLTYYLKEVFKEINSAIQVFQIKTESPENIYYFHEKDLIYNMIKSIIEEYIELKFMRNLELKFQKQNNNQDNDDSISFSIDIKDFYQISSLICEKYSILNNELQYVVVDFLNPFIKHLEYKIEKDYIFNERDRYEEKRIGPLDYHKTIFETQEFSKNPRKPRIVDQNVNKTILIEFIDDKKYNFLAHILKKTKTLIDENNLKEALKTINTGLAEVKKIDLQLEKEEDREFNRDYYYFRIEFYSKKAKILLELKQYNELAILMIDVDHIELIDSIVTKLINIGEISYAKKGFDNVFLDPSNKIPKESLDEFRSECYFSIEANFHNKVLDLYRNDKNEKAILTADKFLKFNPNATDILKIKAFALAELKKYKEALEVIDEAIKVNPKGSRILGENWLKELTEEEESKKRIKSYEDSNYQYNFYIAKTRLLMKMNNYKESKAILNRIINLNPRVSEAHFLLSSIIAYKEHNYKGALRIVDNAIKHENGTTSKYYGLKADLLLMLNKPRKALETINQLGKRDSEGSRFLSIKSEALERIGKYKEALIEVNKLIKLDNKRPWNYYKKAFILNRKGDYSEALENIDIALEFKPKDFVYIQDKISILENLGRIDEALSLIDQEETIIGKHAEQFRAQMYQQKANQLLNSDKKDEAIETIKKAIKIDPEEANYFNKLGEIYMKYGEYEEAIKQLEIAKKLVFTPIETYLNLGKCFYYSKNYERALENIKIARNLATHSVKTIKTDENGKQLSEDSPQTDIMEEAKKFIIGIENKLKS